MVIEAELFRIGLTEFLSFFPLRAPRVMWFLGAGASVTAGLPTAGTLTWEFKRVLYCKAHSISVNRFPDLDDRGFQNLVQSYFESQSGNPTLWDDAEYSHYFQKYLPDERDRRAFLSDRLSGTKPALGHYCLASLLTLGKARIVWTTNFDTLVERAFQEIQARSSRHGEIPVVNLANPDVLTDCIQGDNWPVVVKLHGDYFHRKLKNLTTELQSQDQTLRRWLIDESGRNGMAVVGYSGRDLSIMEAFETALSGPNPFPQGLFWFVRTGTSPAPSVLRLLEAARNNGVQAGFIETGGFDELLHDIFLDYENELPQTRDMLKSQREFKKPFNLSYDERRWPVIRTNALEVTRYPSTCTLFESEIGGSREIRELIAPHSSRITAGRKRAGVIAFGNRADITEVFADYQPRNFDRYPIEPKRFRHSNSQELGLLYDALCQGLAALTGLTRLAGKKGRILHAKDASVFTQDQTRELARMSIVPVRRPTRTGPYFHEGISIGLEYQDTRLWLLVRPTVVATTDGDNFYSGPDRAFLIREQTVRRYNRQSNDLQQFWISFITDKGGNPISVPFPNRTNIDVEFQLSPVSAFARPT